MPVPHALDQCAPPNCRTAFRLIENPNPAWDLMEAEGSGRDHDRSLARTVHRIDCCPALPLRMSPGHAYHDCPERQPSPRDPDWNRTVAHARHGNPPEL